MTNRVNWLYFLEDNINPKNWIFLYGLSLPMHHKVKEFKDFKKEVAEISETQKVYMFRSMRALVLVPCMQKIIDFSQINSEFASDCCASITLKKTVIQVSNNIDSNIPESLIKSPMLVDIYYTDSFSSYKKNFYKDFINVEALAKITQILRNETGQSFNDAYSKRLGCFEYASVQAWSEETTTPFVFENKEDKILFGIKEEFKQIMNQSLQVHLIAYKDDEIVCDQLILITSNEEQYSFNVLNSYHYYEYWVFNREGKLIDRDKCFFIEHIEIIRKIKTASYKLSSNNFSKNSSVKSISDLNIYHSIPINISPIYSTGIQRHHYFYENLRQYNLGINEDKYSRWFERTEKAEDLIKYLNDIANSGEITIIDPYFTKDSLDFLIHLNNAELRFKIISCQFSIPKTDNETKSAMKKYDEYKLPIANRQWRILKKGKFHDRFIRIKQKEDEQVYLLSNSLNNLSKKDFCIVLLSGELRKKALQHIDRLWEEGKEND